MLGSFSFAKYLMWKDLTDRTDALKRNPVVRHLIETPRERYACDAEPPRPEVLDAQVSPAELFAPLPADSSQLAAVIGSARGCDFVLDGPPGTGKSQTIANMIAHNLALGRRVLFVAEKRAALEVVHRRLVLHGLGPFCLELHSNKAAKADVLAQLDRAWTTRENLAEGEWERRAAELKTTRDKLNRLVEALHRLHPNGMTLHQALGRVVRDGETCAVRLKWPETLHHDSAQMAALREGARNLDLHHPGHAVEDGALRRVGQSDWSPGWQSRLLAAASELDAAARAVAPARAELLRLLGAEIDGDAHGLAALSALTTALDAAAGADVAFAFAPEYGRLADRAREAMTEVTAYRDEAALLSRPQGVAAVRALDVAQLETDWRAATGAVWPLSIFRKGALAKRLHPSGQADVAADLPRLRRLQERLTAVDAAGSDLTALQAWKGLDTDADRLERLLDVAAALRGAVVGAARTPDQLIALRPSLRKLCVDGADLLGPDGAVGAAGTAWRAIYARFRTALEALESVAASSAPIDAPDIASEAQAVAAAVQADAPRLNAWCAWRRARNEALDLGLTDLVDALEAESLPAGGAAEAFEIAYARWWADAVVEADTVVREFNVAAQSDAIARFRELDTRFAELTQLYIRAKLSGGIPPKDSKTQPPGFGVLAHQLRLQRRQKPVRQLVGEMGPALTTLTPCLLMSPLSVAQYLPPDAALFDLVIFDEASQIAPWDAVGALARGRQAVVAGDPKQMPPTSFFDRGAGASDDDSDLEEDQESILDECLSASLPQRQLTWHYRSRNESLIAFSNHRYYGGELITFPAPVVKDDAVRLRPVAEAKALVDEVTARLRDPAFVDETGAPLTMGVITLNAEQQKLVEDLLDRARRADPSLDRFFAEDLPEPVVVKNLETVQGDERDLILLGVGYGPETPGAPTMAMNFGPLNRKGGWRRLNVAITRARREMVVFASFPPNLIDLNRTSAEAVRDLKHFMEFAERGPRALGEAVAGSVGGFESPFEQAVARALRDRGWTVAPQIGVSRFRIDLGVVHPDRPGDYLVGVECDGASYHSAATARDRDKVREAVLKGLGWSLLRVWSTDWWIDPRGALDRLVAGLDTALAASREKKRAEEERAAVAPPSTPPVESGDVEAEQGAAEADVRAGAGWSVEPGGDYRATTFDDMRESLARDRFDEPSYAPVLRAMIMRVIAQEAPVRDEILVERIARAHGIQRNGRRVRDRVLSIARGCAHMQEEGLTGGAFVWPDGETAETWTKARYPATNTDVRQLEDIALPEIAAALRECASADRAVEAARRFGVRRLSSVARSRLDRAVPPQGHFAG